MQIHLYIIKEVDFIELINDNEVNDFNLRGEEYNFCI